MNLSFLINLDLAALVTAALYVLNSSFIYLIVAHRYIAELKDTSDIFILVFIGNE